MKVSSLKNYIISRQNEINRLKEQIVNLNNKISLIKKSIEKNKNLNAPKQTILDLNDKLLNLIEQKINLKSRIKQTENNLELQNEKIRKLEQKKHSAPKIQLKNKLKVFQNKIYDSNKDKEQIINNPKIQELLKSGEFDLVKIKGRWEVIPNEYKQKKLEEKENKTANLKYTFSLEYLKDIGKGVKNYFSAPLDIIKGFRADPEGFKKGMEAYWMEEFSGDLNKIADKLEEYRLFKDKKELNSISLKTPPETSFSLEEIKKLERERLEKLKKDKIFFEKFRAKINKGEGYALRDEKNGGLKFIYKDNLLKENIKGMAYYYIKSFKDMEKHKKAALIQIKDSALNMGKSLIDMPGTLSDTARMISQAGKDPDYINKVIDHYKEEFEKDPLNITRFMVDIGFNIGMLSLMRSKKMPSFKIANEQHWRTKATPKQIELYHKETLEHNQAMKKIGKLRGENWTGHDIEGTTSKLNPEIAQYL
ncbi:MAG: hypothetical protein HYU63_05610, partial [Armatimonadetes bacterium]|nr:hypothetical protein [Armatimonadota bacterium]